MGERKVTLHFHLSLLSCNVSIPLSCFLPLFRILFAGSKETRQMMEEGKIEKRADSDLLLKSFQLDSQQSFYCVLSINDIFCTSSVI